jgi:hypothetical protein
MKTEILSTIAAMIWSAGVVQDSPAQTRSEMRMDHASPGHQMNGPLDGAFHHRFEDAKKWAEEFDNPERDTYFGLPANFALTLEKTEKLTSRTVESAPSNLKDD